MGEALHALRQRCCQALLGLPLLIVFAPGDFPARDVPTPLPEVAGAVVAHDVDELVAALRPGDTLVWRHGSTFPAAAWPELLGFLEHGGSLLHLGGAPFTRPVVRSGDRWIVQDPTLSPLKALHLGPFQTRAVDGLTWAPVDGALPERTLPDPCTVTILQPRLTDGAVFPDEEGSPGPRDAVLRPLAYVHAPGADRRFPVAAASLVIDQLAGRFAGGRWVFHLLNAPPGPDELARLLELAAQPPVALTVDPTDGCYHAGERPAVTVGLRAPRAGAPADHPLTLRLTRPSGARWEAGALHLRAGREGRLIVPLPEDDVPGLYRVTVSTPGAPDATTGFWVLDPELFTSGSTLSFDADTLRRDGRPLPVIGTTVMSSRVHRDFLFEPDAAGWDDTFAELADLHIGLVRTGMWSGWSRVVDAQGRVDEAWLRALEAYYLSARSHGLPVLFTFFAFFPPAFGGTNPYLDPRAVATQSAFLSTVAGRFAGAKEILWDLVNEPSFCAPGQPWSCRPNGDAHEAAAFEAWLAARLDDDPAGWRAAARDRWRLLPGAPVGLPGLADFDDGALFGSRRPYRAQDWTLFAQDAFAGWIDALTLALREGGSTAPVTVGQDEGGLLARPGPLFHHRHVDFTSMHTWWFDDRLPWDGLMAKGRGTPLLISETGVMGRELRSGAPVRDDEQAARLLGRKLACAFAAGAFGAVQWCYDTDPYLASDNEASIGAVRVDGSVKPEHAVLARFAAFVARNARWFDRPAPPRVAVIVPTTEQLGPRPLAEGATWRAVDLLTGEPGLSVQMVAEARTAEDLGDPALIVLPACRGLSDAAWHDLLGAVERGATLLCSGWFEQDEVGRPAARLDLAPRPLATVEALAPGDPAWVLRYPREITGSCFAALQTQDEPLAERRVGAGRILHVGPPLEWAEPAEAQRTLYARALTRAGVLPPEPAPPGLLHRSVSFARATLHVLVNESARPITRRLSARTTGSPSGEGDGPPPVRVTVPAGEARMVLCDPTGAVIDATHALDGD